MEIDVARMIEYVIADDKMEIIEGAIQSKSDANKRTPDGYSILMLSIMNIQPKTAIHLIKNGADLDEKSEVSLDAEYDSFYETQMITLSGLMPIHLATMNCLGVLEAIINAGGDINARDGNGNTPLHHACIHDRDENANILIKAGADLEAKNHNGLTPLDFLLETKHLAVISTLVVAGAKYQLDFENTPEEIIEVVQNAVQRNAADTTFNQVIIDLPEVDQNLRSSRAL